MRIEKHPVLPDLEEKEMVEIKVDGKTIKARKNEPIAAALMASGIKVFRKTPKYNQPRGVFCAIGRCTDCVMTVNGRPNVRTCVREVEAGMVIETQTGKGKWRHD